MLQKFIFRRVLPLAILVFTTSALKVKAQQTSHYTASETVFRDAVSMFEVEQYWQALMLQVQYLH